MNSGFAEPAQGALISLGQLTTTLLIHCLQYGGLKDRIATVRDLGVIQNLLTRAGEALADTEIALDSTEAAISAGDSAPDPG
jgi:hypothetical protein